LRTGRWKWAPIADQHLFRKFQTDAALADSRPLR